MEPPHLGAQILEVRATGCGQHLVVGEGGSQSAGVVIRGLGWLR
ncbi:MAG: hypothetical protein ACYCZP_10900 [Acidimicrobiales bacterium]